MPVVETPMPRRRPRAAAAILAGAAVIALAIAPAALAAPGDVEITFASDTTWTTTDADAGTGPALTLPANAQQVCLNATAPSPCPDGATQYGWGGGGWATDLSTIPGATWIWAPGIDGSTEPADLDAYFFSRTFAVPGTPTGGSISVAVDDHVEVCVNGTSAGTSGGPGLATMNLTSLLQSGDNVISVKGINGLICNAVCSYARNPGGVVFGGWITYTPASEPTPAPTATPEPTLALTPPPTSTIGADDAAPAAGGMLVALLAAAVVLTAAATIVRPGRRQR